MTCQRVWDLLRWFRNKIWGPRKGSAHSLVRPPTCLYTKERNTALPGVCALDLAGLFGVPYSTFFLNRNKQASKSLVSCCSQQTLLQTPQHCWGLCARRPEPSRSPGERAPMLFAKIALKQECSVGGTGEKTLLSCFFPFNSGLSAYLAVIWKNSEGWYLRALSYCCSLHFGTCSAWPTALSHSLILAKLNAWGFTGKRCRILI